MTFAGATALQPVAEGILDLARQHDFIPTIRSQGRRRHEHHPPPTRKKRRLRGNDRAALLDARRRRGDRRLVDGGGEGDGHACVHRYGRCAFSRRRGDDSQPAGGEIQIGDLLEEAGVQGLAALDDEGNICAFVWYSDRDYYDRHYYRCWFPVTAPGVYLFAVEVAPGHRGSALILGGQEHLWERLRTAGHQHARAVVDARNARARKLLEHLGFQPLGWQTRVFTLLGCLRLCHQPPAVRDQLGSQSGSLAWYRLQHPFRRFP
ncbi:MAG TPA: GNAT family N-acetyltransferase, partial [Polyangia bacterium]